MSVGVTQSFISGGTTCVISSPVPGSLKHEIEPMQNVVKSASGAVYVDDKGVTSYRASMSVSLTEAQRDALESFYRSTVTGSLNTFTWLDHENTSWGSVRFHPDMNLSFAKTAGARWTCEIILKTANAFGG